MANPKISIVTVCFNAELALEETIKSVISQTYSNIEYIIIDGGSKDSTMLIVDRYREHFSTVISEPDKGIYDAMNKSLSHVTGDYVYFLGAGDLLVDKNSLQELVSDMSMQNADIIAANVNVLDEQGDFLYLKTHEWINDRRQLLSNTICHQGVLIKSELVKQLGGFDTSYRICADYAQMLKLILSLRVKTVSSSTVIANYPTDGVSGVTTPAQIAKVNREFARARSPYLSNWEKFKRNVRVQQVKVWVNQGFNYVRALLNVLTAWTVVFWWVYLKISLYNTRRKHVLIVPEFSTAGGTRTYFLMLLDYYIEQGWKIGVVLNEVQAEDAEMINHLESLNINVYLSKPAGGVMLRLARVFWALSIVMHNQSILHAVRDFRPAFITLSVGTPTQFLPQLFLPVRMNYILHTYPVAKLGVWNRLLVQLNSSARKKIIGVSNYTMRMIRENWGNPKHTTRIYNFVNVHEIQPKSHEGVNILTVGLTEDFKAVDFWARLAVVAVEDPRFQNVRFLWAGSGTMFAYVKHLVSHVSDRVQFLGMLNQEEIARTFSVTDIYLQPSRMESFGMSVVEAMRLGVPVIVSNNGALPEVLGPNKGIVIEAENIELYIDALARLVNETDYRHQLGNTGKQYADKLYDRSRWATEITNIHN